MSKTYKEKLTVNGKNIIFERKNRPINSESVNYEDSDLKLMVCDIKDTRLVPSNYNDPEGVPMTLFQWEGVKLELSKRTVEEMSYWHRTADFDEIIFCFDGAIRWETDLGEITLEPGQMMLIPRGIAHRSMPVHNDKTNIIIEFKIWPSLKEVHPGIEGMNQPPS